LIGKYQGYMQGLAVDNALVAPVKFTKITGNKEKIEMVYGLEINV